MNANPASEDGPIIDFDAMCVLCSANAAFVLRHDRAGRFRLASMQGDIGAALYRRFGIDPANPESLIVVDGDRALQNSDAVLAIWAGLDRPWNALSSYDAPLPQAETFEVYPNRDSVPFIEDYRFDPAWPVRDFVRGTLRLNGWSDAWADVFAEIESLSGPEGDARLKEMSDQFWAENAYDDGEPDRVVLCVELKAAKDGKIVWHKSYVMDAWGDARGTAMARLVSVPVSLAVEAVLTRAVPAGVTAAPSDPRLVGKWMDEIGRLAQHLAIVDRTTV